MNLENIYYIGQSIAVLAVLATLLTLIFQIRQSNKLARTEMSLMTWLPSIEKYYDVLASDDDSKFFYKAFHTADRLTDAERIRFAHFASYIVNSMETMFLLDQDGLCNKTLLFRHSEGIKSLLISSRFRKWWRNTKDDYYTPDFRVYMDELVEKSTPKSMESQSVQF